MNIIDGGWGVKPGHNVFELDLHRFETSPLI